MTTSTTRRGGVREEIARPERPISAPERRSDDVSQGRDGGSEGLARALGIFSLGLGLAQISMPGDFARWIGVPPDDGARAALRAVGLREIVSGLGLLAQPGAPGWAWARLGGDLMDIALLGAALSRPDVEHERLAAALATVLGVTGLDLSCGAQLSGGTSGLIARASQIGGRPIDVKAAITINRPQAEIFRFWRDFSNLPRFMSHLEAVQVLDDRRSRWRAKAPANTTVEWEAEIVDERPDELIVWRSLEGAQVPNAGSVRFAPAPGGRGTEVHVALQYQAPGGAVGATIARLFGEEPGQQVRSDLRRLKQVIEAGEVIVSSATIDGPNLFQPPAQPPERRPAPQPGLRRA